MNKKLRLISMLSIAMALVCSGCETSTDPSGDGTISNDPVYWSKCESRAGLTTGEIGRAVLVDNGASNYHSAYGKFGNGIVNNSYAEHTPTAIVVSNFNYEELTLSAWIKQWHIGGGTASMHHTFYFTADTYITLVISTSGSYYRLYVNGVNTASLTYTWQNNVYKHITIAYSRTGCKAWQGETLMLDYSGELPAATQCVVEFRSYSYGDNDMAAYLDNLKVWGKYIDDPEYRTLEASGTAESETMLH